MALPKSTALKLLHGTARPDRIRDLPRFTSAIPKAPANLSAAGRKHWREMAGVLSERRVLTAGDRQVLALTCTALVAHDAAQAVLTEKGSTYEMVTKSGSVFYRPRVEVHLAAEAWGRAIKGLVELGLTPRARGAVEVAR